MSRKRPSHILGMKRNSGTLPLSFTHSLTYTLTETHTLTHDTHTHKQTLILTRTNTRSLIPVHAHRVLSVDELRDGYVSLDNGRRGGFTLPPSSLFHSPSISFISSLLYKPLLFISHISSSLPLSLSPSLSHFGVWCVFWKISFRAIITLRICSPSSSTRM